MDPLIIVPPGGSNPRKKKLFATILVAVLLLAIPLGVYLVGQTQIFKPKAGGGVEPPVTKFFLSGPEAEYLCFLTSPCPPIPLENVTSGTIFQIDVLARSDLDAANHFIGSISYPKDLLEVMSIDAPIPYCNACDLHPTATPTPIGSPAVTPGPITSTNANVPKVTNVVSAGVPCSSGGGIKISWTNPSGILFHRIDKTSDGTTWVFAGFTDGNITPPATEFIDKSGTPGSFYAYRVYAAGNTSNPGYSDPVVQTQQNWVPLPICSTSWLPNLVKEAFAQSTIDPVTSVTSTALECQGDKSPIRVSWTNPQFANFHRIERTSDNITWSTVGFTESNPSSPATSFTDLTPLANTFYAYRVYAAGDAAHAGYSTAAVQTNSTWPLSKVCTTVTPTPTATPTGTPTGSPVIVPSATPTPTATPTDPGLVPTPTPNPNPILYPITEWIHKTFDNLLGKILLDGKVANPGLKTDAGGGYAVIATIRFKAKAIGSAPLSFTPESQIIRASDNQNILVTSEGVTITINPVGGPTPTSATTGKGDGNNDGNIDLVDLSILLSNYNRNNPELDFNSDGIINGIDYSSMIQLLLQRGVIKQNSQ